MNNLSDVESDSEKEESDPEKEESEEESDSEEEIKNKNNNNDDVKNSDPYLELPEDEFIIDDVDFASRRKDNLEIFEQEIILEHKVISNDEDQAEDLINEILRMMPEKQRKNKKEIKKVENLLESFTKLKTTD